MALKFNKAGDGLVFEITDGDGRALAHQKLTQAEVAQLIDGLHALHGQQAVPVVVAAEDKDLSKTTGWASIPLPAGDPHWRLGQEPLTGVPILRLSHDGLHWLSYAFPLHEARKLATLLLEICDAADKDLGRAN